MNSLPARHLHIRPQNTTPQDGTGTDSCILTQDAFPHLGVGPETAPGTEHGVRTDPHAGSKGHVGTQHDGRIENGIVHGLFTCAAHHSAANRQTALP